MINQTPRRLLSQDFPDDVKNWIQILINPINQFMSAVSTILNKGLTFQHNFNSEIKTIKVSQGDTPTIAYNLRSKPIGVLVLRCDEEHSGVIGIDWVTSKSGIKIRSIAGLETAKIYSLTLLIIGE